MLAVFVLASPAMATVTIDCNDEGSGVVRISYTVTGEPNLVRAFALDVSVDDGNIVAISDYNVGECNSVKKGYGIFMGGIVIDGSGNVLDYNTPVAPADDPNSAGQIPGPAITIEMGSLYVDGNAPGNSGTLCKITVDSDCNVSMVENTRRGGVVLENPAVSPSVVLNNCSVKLGNCWDANFCVGQYRGDADCNGDINLDDLIALKKSFGKDTGDTHGTGVGEYNCCADFDHVGVAAGVVNLDDLIALKLGFAMDPHLGLTPSTGEQACPPGY
jgi:hypothetical protein